MPIILIPVGGEVSVGQGSSQQGNVNQQSIPRPIYVAPPTLEQIIGFVPLTPIDADECRFYDTCCFINPVFGNGSGTEPTYENDVNSFLVNHLLWLNNPLTATIVWVIQEESGGSWSDLVTITDSSYGNFYALNTLSTHNPDLAPYSGFQVNWGLVLNAFGEGVYRIKVTSALGINLSQDFVSEAFCLKAFECILADTTTKFEAWQTGKIGSCTIDGQVYNLCSLLWYDSIRVKGLFGYETTEYDETLLEYQTGLQERVRDEAIQKFQWKSGLLPHWFHERFKTYGLMSDKLFVSDYNYNNTDYSFNRKSVVKAGGYSPDYKIRGYGALYSRLFRVTVEFKEGIQSVIKSLCCPSRSGTTP